jgi:hypothetical protein
VSLVQAKKQFGSCGCVDAHQYGIRSFRSHSKPFKEKNMQKVIKFVFVVLLAVGAVGLTSTAGADPGYGGGAKSCSSC